MTKEVRSPEIFMSNSRSRFALWISCFGILSCFVIRRDEHPNHRVRVDSFLIDAEPVSVNAFARFLNSTSNPATSIVQEWCGVAQDDRRGGHFQLQRGARYWEPVPGTERQPMVLVSWYGSVAYSLWANRRDWRAYRDGGLLPTEAQWEYAARGRTNRRFPWGDDPVTPDRALVGLHRARTAYASLLPLAGVQAQLGISPFGLHHMAGNSLFPRERVRVRGNVANSHLSYRTILGNCRTRRVLRRSRRFPN